jgi:hypothetical protein
MFSIRFPEIENFPFDQAQVRAQETKHQDANGIGARPIPNPSEKRRSQAGKLVATSWVT